MLTILRSKSGMNGHSKRRLGVSLNCEKSDTKLCLYISVGSKESRWAPPKSNGLKPIFVNYIFDGLFCVGKSAISHPHCHSWVITCRYIVWIDEWWGKRRMTRMMTCCHRRFGRGLQPTQVGLCSGDGVWSCYWIISLIPIARKTNIMHTNDLSYMFSFLLIHPLFTD